MMVHICSCREQMSCGRKTTDKQPNAGISALYDVLHGRPPNPIVTRAHMNERMECEKRIRFLCDTLPHISNKSILTIDRGYLSIDSFAKLLNIEPEICHKDDMTVRVVKFELPSGEIETLATNLLNFPAEQIIKLYSTRWGIVTAYFRLKFELSIDKFVSVNYSEIQIKYSRV